MFQLIIPLLLLSGCLRTITYQMPLKPIEESDTARLETLCSESGVQYVATPHGLALDFDRDGEFILCGIEKGTDESH